MRSRDQRGEGKIKNIILLAIVAYGIFWAVKVIPVSIKDKEIVEEAASICKHAFANNLRKVEDVRYRIGLKVDELELPVDKDKIQITKNGNDFRIQFSYDRDIDLLLYHKVYTVKVDSDAAGPI